MKLIQRLTLLSSIALLAGACDLQQTFDKRIDDKQLLVLSPDFADTSVQLVFRDPETLAVLDEDFEVTVYSNKRLVDLNGNYKNEFIARGGVMEFSVSPEETVSESDPLQILVNAHSLSGESKSLNEYRSFENKGFNSAFFIPSPGIDLSTINDQEVSFSKTKENNVEISKETEGFFWSLNGLKIGESRTGMVVSDVLMRPISINFGGDSKYNSTHIYTTSGTANEDIKLELNGNLAALNIFAELSFYNALGEREYLLYDSGANYFQRIINKGFLLLIEDETLDDQVISSFLIPQGASEIQFYALVDVVKNNCNNNNGFNFSIDGLEPGEKIEVIGTAFDPSKTMGLNFGFDVLGTEPFRNTEFVYVGYYKYSTSVLNSFPYLDLTFQDSNQYTIEPKSFRIEQSDLCENKIVNLKLSKKVNTKKHQLNLSMRNENQNVGLALTFSALLRKQGQGNTSWETINFKQGSASVYLEEGSTYEVKLTLADEPFEFTFTNDLSLVEAAVQATKRNVTRIKDINYRIEQTTDMNTIDAEIVFFEGQSLID
jgi:hypothetical protein